MSEEEIVENWLNMRQQQPVQLATQEAYWQHYRIQAAIAAMQGMLANPDSILNRESIVEAAIKVADALINELKGGQDGM